MYLSKLELDISSPSVRQALRDCHDMHRSIMKAFDTDRTTAGVLYRRIDTKTAIELYVLSAKQGQWDKISTMGYHLIREQDISALPSMYGERTVLRFSLLAAPTKKIAGEGKNSRRVFLRTSNERADWMARQAEKNGFRLLELHETGAEVKLSSGRATGSFQMSAVPFEGILEIVDQQLFWKGYQNGIGPEKPYGLGLMMLSRGSR